MSPQNAKTNPSKARAPKKRAAKAQATSAQSVSDKAAARSDKAEEIMRVAERMARLGGYNNFSFREIAKEVGVKSASVHYHFATKEALGAAIAARYTENFLNALGPPEAFPDPRAAIDAYIAACRKALSEDGLMCLCGVFGAEITALPPAVAIQAKRFFDENIAWLSAAYAGLAISTRAAKKDEAYDKALRAMAALEGAMILTRTLGDIKIFDTVMKEL